MLEVEWKCVKALKHVNARRCSLKASIMRTIITRNINHTSLQEAFASAQAISVFAGSRVAKTPIVYYCSFCYSLCMLLRGEAS